ncbi:hypothetical protein [Actinoallomurus sp. NPDC052274]|uniref:hypothetical protein n=1 Tax=Actinoallomurus sp. NPDC052274 TaxID=3155420 RepID=UPI003427808A
MPLRYAHGRSAKQVLALPGTTDTAATWRKAVSWRWAASTARAAPAPLRRAAHDGSERTQENDHANEDTIGALADLVTEGKIHHHHNEAQMRMIDR